MPSVPTAPVTLQLSHVPLHAVSQQTPSTQEPDAHSAAAEHVVLFAALTGAASADDASIMLVETSTPASDAASVA